MKTVAGYLNSQGGILLIGVSDEGQPVGLNRDGFKSEDRMVLHWVNLINSCLGAEFIPWIRTTVHTVMKERILVVECKPASKPVFVTRDNDEAFYVRMTNSTQALKTREVIAYIEQRFPDKQTATSALPGGQNDSADRENSVSQGSSQAGEATTISEWFQQLQRRRVIRTAVIYVVVAWAITEISTTVAETFGAPSWLLRAIIVSFVAGFPVAILLSWLYDIRVTRTEETETRSSLLLRLAAIALLAVATVGLYVLIGRQ